ncbi:MAG: DUF814 domain-containing protein, partial [candidate division Zixibacteria bacterium]|nr:DUF814 domain-containing protein [candidate division Zixibacteria bacterium]
YPDLSTPQAFPFKLKSINSEPVRFPSYSLAQMSLSGLRKATGESKVNEKTIRKAIASAVRKQEKTIAHIEADQKEAANYDRKRQIADLIKSSLDKIPVGAASVTLDDLYDENSESVTIKLDPKLTAAENADLYYRKFQKGRDAQPQLIRRLEISRADLARLSEIETALADSFESASARYESEINEIVSRPRSAGGTRESAQRLPYRIYTLSTGAKVFVGKQGADNDETTFKHIKPYELWFHASQCSGSHVGLKFPSKSFAPSKEEIAETAGIAAWFSKARKNKAAPVNYTERRYVRKPRKAKPGLVTIEREKTIMVSPREPSANANS